MSSEDQLIERVKRKFPVRAKDLRVGIGDDAAVLSPSGRTELVLTTDAFLENVHFLRQVHSARIVGFKALARATSDLAAMGAIPRYFLLALALPAECTGKWLDGFIDGMAQAARQFGLTLAGGDTSKYPSIVINLTVLGEVERRNAVLRSGARAGDAICVSGRLGEAELGLQLVLRGLHRRARLRKLLTKHLRPQPRLALGRWLAENDLVSAMIDTSDGLSTDLAHICKASGVGATIWGEKIPAVSVPADLQKLGLAPWQLALHGGDDYELLFTVPRRMLGKLPRQIRGVPVAEIGEITRDKRITLIDEVGEAQALRAQGWDPFRGPTAKKKA